MPYTEPIYQLALTQVPHIGPVLAKLLVEHLGSAEAIFKASKKTLTAVEGISLIKATAIRDFRGFAAAEDEWKFVEKNDIRVLFIGQSNYPLRLMNCYDPPTVLFYKGEASLNAPRILNIIGTRNHTDYGRMLTEKLVEELAPHDITIISGMAFGIDTVAHKSCVRHHLPTVGVLAHGLDRLYPAENARLAKNMLEAGGGLLTECWSGTKPDKHNFPIRNRIVAGLSDATVVVETDIKGGSMITAELAVGYNRDLFAFPGRVNENKSRGCHQLIRQNKAVLITSANDLLEAMNWLPEPKKKPRIQRSLFIELTPNERTIYDLLNAQEEMPLDELNFRSGLSPSAAAAALLTLELQGVVVSLPGKRYKLA